MTDQPRHREYEGDYYGETHQKLARQTGHFGAEDQVDAKAGVDGQTEKAASQYSVSQGEQLLQGQSIRGDAPAPDANYPSYTHDQLYGMVHNDLSPESLDDRGRVANKLGNWLADVSTAAKDAAGSAEVEWQGPAASQAHGFFQTTASYAEQSGSAAQLSSNRYSQQAAAAANAQKYMPPPSGFDQSAEMNKATQQLQSGDLVGGTNAMNAIAAKQQQAQADHEQAVRVMQAMDSTYHSTAGTQPTYTPPPQLGGDDGSTFASSAHVSAPGGTAQSPGWAGGGSAGSPGAGQGSFSGASGAGNSLSGSAGSPAAAGSGVGAGSVTGSGPGGSSIPVSGVRGSSGGFGVGGPRMFPDGTSMLSGTTGSGGAGGDITRGRSGPGSGRAGSGFAGSRVSGGGYSPGKSGTAGEVAGKAGPGKGSGSGTVSERLERGGTAASAKAAGAGGQGAAGAGAGKKKEEDKEHKNKVPLSLDPEEVFEVRPERGPDGETVTPPVIGH
jgi:hypothetical protein